MSKRWWRDQMRKDRDNPVVTWLLRLVVLALLLGGAINWLTCGRLVCS